MLVSIGVCAYGLYFWFQKSRPPLKIGVLLALTGKETLDANEVLDWAKDNLNKKGGINHRQIELVYKDTAGKDIKKPAEELASDPAIKIVIGPDDSEQVFEIAPIFIKNKKILISPSSTAGNVFRAFGKQKFFYRTAQSDIAQMRIILALLSKNKVKKIALLTEESEYGRTFFSWGGFFAKEMDLELTKTVQIDKDEDLTQTIKEVLKDKPEYLIAAVSADELTEIKKELDKNGGKTKLLATDKAATSLLIEKLGKAAAGIEFTAPVADPKSGFNQKFEDHFQRPAFSFAAEVYDAFLLSVYTLARQEKMKNEGLDQSFEKVVSGEEDQFSFDQDLEVAKLILKGKLPNISGASGPLKFDSEFGVDPLVTFYARMSIEPDKDKLIFKNQETIGSNEALSGFLQKSASVGRTTPSDKYLEPAKINKNHAYQEKKELFAVIVASSNGWENYRHQADALAIYRLLKSKGLSDDKIILFLTDDIAENQNNLFKGNVHQTINGKNLRENVEIDYSENEVTAENFKNVLLGRKSSKTPTVLETDDQSNVLIYLVDHGSGTSVPFAGGGELPGEELNRIIQGLDQKNKYRQLLLVADVCLGGDLLPNLKTPGVLYLTGSSENEPSLAANYDSQLENWLSDEFTNQFLEVATANPEISLAAFYTTLYKRVVGSHVEIENFENFGNIDEIKLKEFLTP